MKFILEKQHQNTYLANFSGSIGNMEVTGKVNIFRRSVPNYNVRYIEYLGNSGCKAYIEVCNSVPYGNNMKIQEIECVGHIQKRMGPRLKMKQNKPVLPDGSKAGEKNQLTNAAILQMQIVVWAEYFHLSFIII